jgi:hypothetical protein
VERGVGVHEARLNPGASPGNTQSVTL